MHGSRLGTNACKGTPPGMYDAVSASELKPSGRLQRATGEAAVAFFASDGRVQLEDLFQSGSAKIRLPRIYGSAKTAVLINTAGGLTGGDQLKYQASAGPDVHAIVTTQTAERAYRSLSGTAKVETCLEVGDGGLLEWLPQEAILFDRSSLSRSVHAELKGTARLMAIEGIVLGRKAMGEIVQTVAFRDSWRIRRNEKLVFADDMRLDGDPADFLSSAATGAGTTAVSTFIDCCVHAEDRLEGARKALSKVDGGAVHCGCSAWNGVLVSRFASPDARALRCAVMDFLTLYRAADLPRVWYC